MKTFEAKHLVQHLNAVPDVIERTQLQNLLNNLIVLKVTDANALAERGWCKFLTEYQLFCNKRYGLYMYFDLFFFIHHYG